ncbi:MAG: restriction endonuclease [Nitrospirae bacterium]|nr:restriction endonuclease [Nitrospirota bacterium]
MTDDKTRLIELLVKTIPELTAGQLQWLQRVVHVFSARHDFKLRKSDLFDETILQNFGDAMRVHHSFSSEPFSKDKFEYVLVKVLKMSGHKAALAPKGNPGHDATADGIKLSLKTQADKGVKEDIIWISKFMELGKGNWGNNPEDLVGLRQQFLAHMKAYDRILTLRTLAKSPKWKYELVEIPKGLLMKAKTGELKMMGDSRQYPKPGYCYIRDQTGGSMFELYFDGGTERKLQIKNLNKNYCSVHAIWEFIIPPE